MLDAILAIEPLNQIDVVKPIPKSGWCSRELKHSWRVDMPTFVLMPRIPWNQLYNFGLPRASRGKPIKE